MMTTQAFAEGEYKKFYILNMGSSLLSHYRYTENGNGKKRSTRVRVFVQVRVELSETQRSQQQLSTQTHSKQISDIHMRMYAYVCVVHIYL